mmetsp:Transcript_12581/g.38479  ORF Transcript_12581/g.38479 Transcript_12581/m.38479 type:complete len:235 (+) Transcript_12581:2297-3001(+)
MDARHDLLKTQVQGNCHRSTLCRGQNHPGQGEFDGRPPERDSRRARQPAGAGQKRERRLAQAGKGKAYGRPGRGDCACRGRKEQCADSIECGAAHAVCPGAATARAYVGHSGQPRAPGRTAEEASAVEELGQRSTHCDLFAHCVAARDAVLNASVRGPEFAAQDRPRTAQNGTHAPSSQLTGEDDSYVLWCPKANGSNTVLTVLVLGVLDRVVDPFVCVGKRIGNGRFGPRTRP